LFGYPDDFVFIGSITQVRKQIGNSVPPPAAKALAEALLPAFSAKILTRKRAVVHSIRPTKKAVKAKKAVRAGRSLASISEAV
jgi:hypothetical protein